MNLLTIPHLISRRNPILLVLLVGSLLLILLYILSGRDASELAISGIVGVITWFYSAQKQYLEELKLKKDLFSDFNGRYRTLNARLTAILQSKEHTMLSKDETDTLDEYFNLCAEEYFFYKRGYIDDEVWRSWCNGMMIYFENPRIRKQWCVEEANQSYYGLTLKTIKQASRNSVP